MTYRISNVIIIPYNYLFIKIISVSVLTEIFSMLMSLIFSNWNDVNYSRSFDKYIAICSESLFEHDENTWLYLSTIYQYYF